MELQHRVPLHRVIFRRHIVINSIKIALVVGSLLNIINQGPQLVSGIGIVWWQIALNFVVPFCVASYSAAKNETKTESD